MEACDDGFPLPRLGNPGLQAQLARPAAHPLNVIGEAERLAGDHPDHLVDAFAELQRSVLERHTGLVEGDETPVEPGPRRVARSLSHEASVASRGRSDGREGRRWPPPRRWSMLCARRSA